ncbi:hypothetical protein Thein_1504 [Thermodesulfatator indicus DSM 15286]|uniref:Uncharacterized protein n=1 Tax=Thermodesulfatator indicus (strain DSM 15286 / JCM 11887 / CIR29812) TaxID=667014 RepID=F8AAE5_THEID|nr:hypothetical protein [Thermodesulfatator indicus]AEH45365.1 hypothetical protein Thein_1504 [Thermodesulfatator indicus DSM 15286]
MFDAKTLLSLLGIELSDEELEQTLIQVARQSGQPLIEQKMPDGSWRIVGVGSIKAMRRFYRRIGMRPRVSFKDLRERWITQ